MRDAMAALGGDPGKVNPLVPADLVIDHSVQVDQFGTPAAFAFNVGREYERNGERYQLLRWAQTAFRDLRVVPPGTGIVHQVNLEFLATVVTDRDAGDGRVAYPDTLVGTDSHTTMINGLGVLGFGVGGIEAEAVLLGQPIYQPMPQVVGVRLRGELPGGATATDLVLVVTEMLRDHGVVGSFVEFAGDGLAGLSLADRATISNMSPEFGATATLFPIDDETLTYLRLTGRSTERIELVEQYAREQGLWRVPGDGPVFDELLELDLATVVPSVAGPRRPQDRVPLTALRENFRENFPAGLGGSIAGLTREEPIDGNGTVEEASAESFPASDAPSFVGDVPGDEPGAPSRPVADGRAVDERSFRSVEIEIGGQRASVRTGSVAIAAITSCTNTSNPTVMIGAGLLARNAVARGLRVGPTVKTSLAPGSKAVTGYLEAAGLMAPLERLGFSLAGYGCTTCIGNSGPLDDAVAAAVEGNDLVVAAVLSGNRNFEGRIHPLARASYLASPPLVVAFAIAGRVDIDLTREPLGADEAGAPVFLADIWPAPDEIRAAIADSIDPELFRRTYATVFEGDERWRALPIPSGDRYEWVDDSTYIAKPPFFDGLTLTPEPVRDISGARVLAVLGDSVTTDHISPAGSIAPWSPAGQWLQQHGVAPLEFNSYGSRRGHHEVLVRGTFGNIRLRNRLVEGKEGPYTVHLPDGDEGFIYDVAMRYATERVPLAILAGREYGSGSSRDWAAKGPALLGVRFVLAESYERIHRSNLVGMGILPLQFRPGETAASLGLTGRETFDVMGLDGGLTPHQSVTVSAVHDAAAGGDGTTRRFEAIARLDGPIDVEYYRSGGILPTVLRRLATEA
jgi:aconitate hydratase